MVVDNEKRIEVHGHREPKLDLITAICFRLLKLPEDVTLEADCGPLDSACQCVETASSYTGED